MFKLFRNRGILFLGLSNTISQLGDRLTHMVIITFIGTMSPGRVSAFSEFSIAFSLPVLILSPFAGVLVDHWNKRTIMFRCHVIQTILIVLTPTFIRLTHSIVPIWVLVVLFFCLDVFNNTARNVVIPDLVEPADLVPANSLIITLARVATFLGMVGGGYLIAWTGWNLGFYIDASTHLTAGCFALLMGAKIMFAPVKSFDLPLRSKLKGALKIFLVDLRELGILLARDRAVIFVMLSVFVLPFTAAICYTVIIYLVQQTFNMGTAGIGKFGGIIGIGMVIGGLLMGFLGKKISRGLIIIVSVAVLAGFFLIGPFVISPFFLYLVALIAGLVFSLIGIAQDTMLQEDVIKGIRGRIFGTKEFVVNLTFTSSALVVGLIGNRVSPYTIIFCAGIVLLVVTIFSVYLFLNIPKEIRTKL